VDVGPTADPANTVVAVAVGVATGDGDRIVVAAEPLQAVGRSVTTAAELALVIMPVLVAVSGVATYLAVARALRQVEAMRAELEAITDRDLDLRIPVPVARDEVARLAETMNATLHRLRTARTSQRRFVADASHELRSPLSTIVANLQLVLDRSGADGKRLRVAREEADRLGRIVEDLLLLARADERGLRSADEAVDLDEVCFAEQQRLRTLDGVRAVARVEAVRLRGDRAQLARAVRNLIDNAVQHSRSQVELRLRREADTAVIVSDRCFGVLAHERLRSLSPVFQPLLRRRRAAGAEDPETLATAPNSRTTEAGWLGTS
jgi:signal transduction histidine kinase